MDSTPCNQNTTLNTTPNSISKKEFKEILKGVIAFVEVKCDKSDISEYYVEDLTSMGAIVVDEFVPEVTHLIFFGGYRRTYKVALKRKIHIVAAHWVRDCKNAMRREKEQPYLPEIPPAKEEIPFFRKRMFKPIVDQLKAGTFKSYEEEMASKDLEAPMSEPTKSTGARKPCTPKNINRTPKFASTTRKRARKQINVPEERPFNDPPEENEDHIGRYIRNLFNRMNEINSESLSRVVTLSLDAIKSRRRGGLYDFLKPSPYAPQATVQEDGEVYIPLRERCRAKLIAEGKIKDEDDSESREPCYYPLPVPGTMPAIKMPESPPESEVSDEIRKRRKRRRTSVLERPAKKRKVDDNAMLNRRRSLRLVGKESISAH